MALVLRDWKTSLFGVIMIVVQLARPFLSSGEADPYIVGLAVGFIFTSDGR